MKRWNFLVLLFVLIGAAVSAQSTVKDLQDAATGNHPSLEKLENESQALLTRKDQVRVRAPLKLDAGVFVMPLETRLGPQRLRLGISQQFNLNREQSRLSELRAAEAEVLTFLRQATLLELKEKVALMALEIAAIREQIKVTEKFLPLLQQAESIATQRLEAGNGSMVEVLRTQKEMVALRFRLEELARKEVEWLGKASIEISGEEGQLPQFPQTLGQPGRSDGSTMIWFDEEARGRHPELLQLEQRSQALKAKKEATRLGGGPTLAVGLQYIMLGLRQDADPVGNGQDAVLPTISVGLPLARKPYKARQEEVRWEEKQVAQQKLSTRRAIDQKVIALKAEYVSAEAKGDYLKEQIGLSRRILELQTTEYQSGKIRFEEILKTQRELLQLELDEVDTRLRQFKVLYNRYNYLPEN